MTTKKVTLLAWAFILIWGMGFVASKTGLVHAQPFTFLSLRFVFGFICVATIAVWIRAPLPASLKLWLHIIVAGLLVHAIHLSGSHYGQRLGLSAGGVALIMATQPLLTVLVAPWIGDSVDWKKRLGVAIGFLGVALVVWHKLDTNTGTLSAVFSVALGATSLTLGALYQRHFCQGVNVWANSAIQFAVSFILVAPMALIFEDTSVRWSLALVLSLVYLVLLGSITAVNILNALMATGDATRASSMIYFTPAVAVAGEFLLYRVAPGSLTLIGMLVTCAGVALVVNRQRSSEKYNLNPK